MTHSDIAAGDWIDRRLPKGLRPYVRLMRRDRPIGTWLVLWPCLWSLTLASEAWPPLGYVLLFAFGSIVMRGAGCAINDLVDRDIDRQVERTLTRPLVRGDVKVWQALLFVAFLLLIGLGVLLCFNGFTIGLGVSSLLLVFSYPFAKRVIWAPQFVLGLAFNWGALMGWSAVREGLGLPTSFLYLGGILWTLGYDTIYAHQDKRDDALVGVKSLALYLGDQSRRWIAGFYAGALICFSLAGFLGEVGAAFYVVMPAAFAHAVWQLASWKLDDPANCLVRFRSNRDFGLIVFLALLAGRVL